MEEIKNTRKIVGGMITALIIILVIIPLAFGSWFRVSVGEMGIVQRFGSINRVVANGPHLKLPYIENVVKIDVQVQKEQVKASSASKDLQIVNAEVALNYAIDGSKVRELYTTIGDEDALKIRIIDPAIQEAVKAVTAKYTAEELITKRAEVRDAIKLSLTSRLQTEFITVTEFSIVDFDFSPSYNQAIETKVTAEQNALTEKNNLEAVKFKAQQTIETAKAQAETIRIQAQAITQQGGRDFVQLEAIKKWDGHLPAQMIPGSTVPFIDLNK